jgi:hypothetical protein
LAWLVLPAGPRPYLIAASACLPAGFLLLAALRGRWVLLLAARTRLYLTASGRRVVLRYAPQLHGRADIEEILDLAERTLSQLEGRFGRVSQPRRRLWLGRPLGRGRVYVYLFPSDISVCVTFGAGGFAAAALSAVVVPFEGMPLGEVLRHELTHLLSAGWNAWAPPLLQEGLATWMQGTVQGRAIDWAAAEPLGEGRRLRPLLDRRFFFDQENRWPSYLLAGSFTGFLIGRFGWDAYERFYREQAGARQFDARFKKHFGMTLEQAEALWWAGLLEQDGSRAV